MAEKSDLSVKRRLDWTGFSGISIIFLSEILMFLKVELVATFFTPIAWTGYILLIDNLVFITKGESLIRTRTSEFLVMLPASLCLWLLFEFYNLFIKNWYYVGLPENRVIRCFGYTWAFATIWPAVLETNELLESLRVFRFSVPRSPITPSMLRFLKLAGFVFVIVPFLVPTDTARYLAALVWTGFIFLLDSINYQTNGNSLLRDMENGDSSRLLRLLTSGLICGIIWEFWNYWAKTKWIYTIPILSHVKIFEMPILGYLGFLAFGVEVWVMYESVKIFFLSRIIAYPVKEM